MTKGTGVVKITPAHDPNDFEVGLRHDLPIVRVFTYDGRMTGAADKAAADALLRQEHRQRASCAGLRQVCRHDHPRGPQGHPRGPEGGRLPAKEEPYKHKVGTCYRCGTHHRAHRLRAVVRQDGASGQARHRERGRRATSSSCRSASPRSTSTGWKTSTTGASPASSGGATGSPPGTATTAARWSSAGKTRCSLPEVRRHPPDRTRHPGHLVLLRPVALLHSGLAGRERAQVLLPHQRPRDRLRHHLLLGGPDDLLRL